MWATPQKIWQKATKSSFTGMGWLMSFLHSASKKLWQGLLLNIRRQRHDMQAIAAKSISQVTNGTLSNMCHNL